MDWLLDEQSMELLRSQLPKTQPAAFPYFEVLLKIQKGVDRPRNVTIAISRALKSSARSASSR